MPDSDRLADMRHVHAAAATPREAAYLAEVQRLAAEIERLRTTLERVKIELRGTTAQGGDAEALIDQALAS